MCICNASIIILHYILHYFIRHNQIKSTNDSTTRSHPFQTKLIKNNITVILLLQLLLFLSVHILFTLLQKIITFKQLVGRHNWFQIWIVSSLDQTEKQTIHSCHNHNNNNNNNNYSFILWLRHCVVAI